MIKKHSSMTRIGEQGWRSGESTRLPPMWPGFDSVTRCQMWVEFVVGSRPCSARFFSGYSGFPLSSKTNISKFQFDPVYCQALYREPLIREIVQRLPVLWMLNKFYCWIQGWLCNKGTIFWGWGSGVQAETTIYFVVWWVLFQYSSFEHFLSLCEILGHPKVHFSEISFRKVITRLRNSS